MMGKQKGRPRYCGIGIGLAALAIFTAIPKIGVAGEIQKRESTRSVDDLVHTPAQWKKLNEAFLSQVRNMTEEQKLEKILDLQRELRHYRKLLRNVDNEIDITKLNHEVFVGIQRIGLWSSVISFIISYYSVNKIVGMDRKSLWSYYPGWVRAFLRAPFALLIGNWLAKHYVEANYNMKLELRAEMEIRLSELEDRLNLIEKLLRLENPQIHENEAQEELPTNTGELLP